MVSDICNYFFIEFGEHVTQDKKIKIQQSVQKMKTHFINSSQIKQHNKSLQGYIEEYFPTIAELYCEAVDLKDDLKRKPNKALELLNKVETIYDTFGSQWENEISLDELKNIREIIMKSREGIEQNPQDSYKYILQVLFKLLLK
jgi:predicted RNase H-like nuclease (RuvC/YqgF family)